MAVQFSKAVEEVIRLADARLVYWREELPKQYANYPIIGPDEPQPIPPPEDIELRTFLSQLSEEVIYKLLLTTT